MKKTMITKAFILAFIAMFFSSLIWAQEDKSKRPSPPATAVGKVNGATITINYNSPAVKARKIWGGLVPYNKVWRTGANEATLFETDKDIKVDVRVVTATNRSLLNSVKDKTFRMDLFYRLRVVSFYLPALRDRMEDLPLLTELFIKRFSRKYSKKIKGIAPSAMSMLHDHPWDGNIRELKNVINSAIVLCKGDLLIPEDFESFLEAKAGFKEVDLESAGEDYYAVFTNMLEPVFDNLCQKNKGAIYENINMGLEKALIQISMEKSNNNQVLAAKLLGISRNTLRDRIERYKIN